MTSAKARTPDSVQVIEVIQVEALRGAGVEGDVGRIVTQYWSKDGRLLAERDPFADGDE